MGRFAISSHVKPIQLAGAGLVIAGNSAEVGLPSRMEHDHER